MAAAPTGTTNPSASISRRSSSGRRTWEGVEQAPPMQGNTFTNFLDGEYRSRGKIDLGVCRDGQRLRLGLPTPGQVGAGAALVLVSHSFCPTPAFRPLAGHAHGSTGGHAAKHPRYPR